MTGTIAAADRETYVRDFEAARPADPAALLAADVPPPGDPDRVWVLAELARIDLEYGWAAGDPTPLADYFARFPDLAADPVGRADVAFEDYRQASAAGRRVSPADYRTRFAIDVTGWPAADPDWDTSVANPRTAVVAVGPPAGWEVADMSADSVTVTSDQVVAAAGAYRRFRADPASAPEQQAGLFAALHAGDPAAADRLAAGVCAFPAVGATFGPFRLVEELGRGAFARVYLAARGDWRTGRWR